VAAVNVDRAESDLAAMDPRSSPAPSPTCIVPPRRSARSRPSRPTSRRAGRRCGGTS
jgi:hypothetical protein